MDTKKALTIYLAGALGQIAITCIIVLAIVVSIKRTSDNLYFSNRD